MTVQKSNIGLFQQEAKAGKKTTKTIYEQPSETSVPNYFEPEETSISDTIGQNEQAIDLLNHVNVGHNADFSTEKAIIHEAQDLIMAKRRGVFSMSDTLQIEANPAALDIAIAASEPDKYYLNWMSAVMFGCSAASYVKTQFKDVQFPGGIVGKEVLALPISLGYKYLTQRTSTTTKKYSFATSPIAIPYLTEYSAGIDTAVTDGQGTCTVNGSISTYYAYTINSNLAVGGNTGTAENTSATWEEKNPTKDGSKRVTMLQSIGIAGSGFTGNQCFWFTLAYSREGGYYGFCHLFLKAGVGSDALDLRPLFNGSYLSYPGLCGIRIRHVDDYTKMHDDVKLQLDHHNEYTLTASYLSPLIDMVDIITFKNITLQQGNGGIILANGTTTNPANVLAGTATLKEFTANYWPSCDNGFMVVPTGCLHDPFFDIDYAEPFDWDMKTHIFKLTVNAGGVADVDLSLGMWCYYKWTTDTPGYYSQTINGIMNFHDAEPVVNTPCYKINPSDIDAVIAAGKVFDPVLYTGYLSKSFLTTTAISSGKFDIKTISTGAGKNFGSLEGIKESETFARNTVTSGIALASSSIEGSNECIICITDSELVITSRKISAICKLTANLYLTAVTLIVGGDSKTMQYFGIYNSSTSKHYSPIELNTLSSINMQSITVLNKTDDSIACIITADEYTVYLKYEQIRDIRGSVYLPENMRNEYYVFEEELDSSEAVRYTHYDCANTDNGVLTSYSKDTSVQILEHDAVRAFAKNSVFAMEQCSRTIFSKMSSTALGNAKVTYGDGMEFVTQPIVIPMFYPSYFFGIPGGDSTEQFTTADTTYPYIQYYVNKTMLYDYPKHIAEPLSCSRSLIVASMPAINTDTMEYSTLPSKLTELLRVDNTSYLTNFATKIAFLNSIPICLYANNVYLASSVLLHKADDMVIASDVSNIYTAINFLICVKTSSTEIMTYQKDSWFTLHYSIDDVVIADPIVIGDNIMLVCAGGIYSAGKGKLRTFDTPAVRALATISDGEGYVVMIEAASDMIDTYNAKAATPYDSYLLKGGVTYLVPRLIGDVEMYRIEFDSSIEKLSATPIASAVLSSMIPEGADALKLIQTIEETQTLIEGKLTFNMNLISLSDTPSTTASMTTSPITFIGQAGDVFCMNRIMLITSGSASGTLTITKNSVTISTTTFTVASGTPKTEIEPGYVDMINVKLSFAFTSCSSDFVIHKALAIGTFDPSDEYRLGST